MQATKQFDIIFIGTGISTAYTIMHLLKKLYASKNNARTLHILFVEKEEEFWTGVPYGKRSGERALLITPLKEFIPQGDASDFFLWLDQYIEEKKCITAADITDHTNDWLTKNAVAIEERKIEQLHIPRHWFGMYLKERMDQLLTNAARKGLIDYQLANEEVIDIQMIGLNYRVLALNDIADSEFIAEKVVLAIGSVPSKPVCLLDAVSQTKRLVINNIYQHSLFNTLNEITGFLCGDNIIQANLLIIGSNASALEVIYHLDDHMLTEILKIYVLSSSGQFPAPITQSDTNLFNPTYLRRLSGEIKFTAKKVFECFLADIKQAEILGISRESTYTMVNSLIISLVNQMDASEQEIFVTHYGQKIGTFYRRAGGDYLEKTLALCRNKKIKVIKGEFLAAEGFGFSYQSPDGAILEINDINIIVNCTGSMRLEHHALNPNLLNKLIEKKMCVVNSTGKGFVVNETFQTKKNFFIAGPLLAGNIVGRHKIWHAESCKRIYDIADDLASCLISSGSGS